MCFFLQNDVKRKHKGSCVFEKKTRVGHADLNVQFSANYIYYSSKEESLAISVEH